MTSVSNTASEIREKRSQLGLSKEDFAFLIGLKDQDQALIDSWEQGNTLPSDSLWTTIRNLSDSIPFRRNKTQQPAFTFIDLFAGIGGFRLPFQELGGECVFSSEWDRFSQRTYLANFGELPHGDITKISAADIPHHDVLLAGFPCQSFSQAGLKKGFLDTRGTMFFEIQRVLAEKRPKAFLLENVKQLRGHDNGKTLNTILAILRGEHSANIPATISMSKEAREALSVKLDYEVDAEVLRAADFGVPQNRERVYIVGFSRELFDESFSNTFCWPTSSICSLGLGSILEESSSLDPKYTLSKKLWDGHRRRKKQHQAKGNGFGYSVFDRTHKYVNTLSARYYKDGSEILIKQDDLGKRPRKLTPRECARLQGFPDRFITDVVSDAQSYRQFGNSVAVPVIEAIGKQMLRTLGVRTSETERDAFDVASQLSLRFAATTINQA